MSGAVRKPGFAQRPGDPDAWVRASAPAEAASTRAETYSARLTVDVTPDLRARIKIAAFRRGLTVADMLRAMLEDAFPKDAGDAR